MSLRYYPDKRKNRKRKTHPMNWWYVKKYRLKKQGVVLTKDKTSK